MLLIDQYAYHNRFSDIHAFDKVTFSLFMLLFSLFARDMKVSFTVFLISSIMILLARIPIKYYIKLLVLPITFILLGLIPLMVNFSLNAIPGSEIIFAISMGKLFIYVDMSSVRAAFQLFMVSIGSISCLYLLILTTPLVEILYLLKKWRISPLFIEIIAITYRFLFTLIETVAEIYHSQSSRLGYTSFRTGLTSLGYLTTALFLKSLQKATKLHQAVESRGGYGEFIGSEREYSLSLLNLGVFMIVLLLLVLLFTF